MSNYKYTLEQLKEAVRTSISFSETLKKLGLSQYNGGSRRNIKKRMAENNIDSSHFLGMSAGRGKPSPKKLEFPKHIGRLRKRLIENGLKENKCEVCGIFEWMGEPLTIEMHHLDGDRTNNQLENLQFICPNCHSQTHNFRHKNCKK